MHGEPRAGSQPEAPTRTPLYPVGLRRTPASSGVRWVHSLCSLEVYRSQLLCVYTISIITFNYIISVNTCNDLNRTCNYNMSWCKNPY